MVRTIQMLRVLVVHHNLTVALAGGSLILCDLEEAKSCKWLAAGVLFECISVHAR